MFKARIKATGEVANFNTFKDKSGETMVHKDGSLSFFRPEEVENIEHIGWHSASESPIVPEHHNWISIVAIVCDMDDNSTRATDATFNKDKGWVFPEFSKVLYWCYRPEEE